MKPALRFLFLILGVLFSLVSLVIPISAKQVAKNKRILADMREIVCSIKDFQKRSGRLPSEGELRGIEKTLSSRLYRHYDFQFGSPPSQPEMSYPKERPESGGWMIWFWRGEWSEWDDHCSVADGASFWGFCGGFIFAPLAAFACFWLRSLKPLRKAVEQCSAN